MRMYQKAAFTLVELSIVLVILGLLVGGVLAGQSLIHAAELRKVSRDFTQFQTAIHSFREKYFGLPGDITNATSFWGLRHAVYATCINTPSTDGTTCNGDGNGYISDALEGIRAWQQLANAGMIEGRYTGAPAATPTMMEVGTNMPKGPLNGYYTFPHFGTDLLQLGTADTTGTFYGFATTGEFGPDPVDAGGILSHEDAWNIDTKTDDGAASTGMVRANVTFGPDPVSGTCTTYTLNDTTNTCFLGYLFKR